MMHKNIAARNTLHHYCARVRSCLTDISSVVDDVVDVVEVHINISSFWNSTPNETGIIADEPVGHTPTFFGPKLISMPPVQTHRTKISSEDP